MREIKFKGKRKHGDEILIGDLNQINGQVFIFARAEDIPFNSTDWFEVDPETVGQFTGLLDRFAKEIFEKDIVAITYDRSFEDRENEEDHRSPAIGSVEWNPHGTGWIIETQSPMSVNERGTVMTSIIHGPDGFREVIGSTYTKLANANPPRLL
jgi:hypothetical protein